MASKLSLRMKAATSADNNAPADDEDALLPAAEARAYAEAFVRNGGRQKDAARLAWPDVAPKAAQIRGSKAGRDPRVREYIRELTEAVRRDAQYSAQAAFAESGAALRAASEAGQWSAVAKLIELRSKLSGLLIERVDVTVSENLSLRRALETRHALIARERAELIEDAVVVVKPALAAPTPFKATDPAFAPEPIDVFS